MKREEFLDYIASAIQVDKLSEDTCLLDLDEWDSLAETAVMLAFNMVLGVFIEIQKIRQCNTVKELLDLGNEKYE